VGAPEDIYERPATRFVAEFIGESNLIPAAVAQRLDLRLPSADGAGLYSLRPEKISLSPARVPSDNCLRGTIEDNLYLGTDTQYKVRVDGDWILTTREQNMGRPPYSRGATVYVSWHTEAARAVAPDMES
jgi:ABC-type Fe3+/spermidine/putrescine transport system ATPase subunit